MSFSAPKSFVYLKMSFIFYCSLWMREMVQDGKFLEKENLDSVKDPKKRGP